MDIKLKFCLVVVCCNKHQMPTILRTVYRIAFFLNALPKTGSVSIKVPRQARLLQAAQ